MKGKIERKLTNESKIKIKNQENEIKSKKNQNYGSKDEIENKLKFDKKAKNQNIKGQTLNAIKFWIEVQNGKEKPNSQKNPKQK